MCTRAIIFGIGTTTSKSTKEYQIQFPEIIMGISYLKFLNSYFVSVFVSENNQTIFGKMKRNSNIFT